MDRTLAVHPDVPGSIPGVGEYIFKFANFFLLIEDKIIYRCRSNPKSQDSKHDFSAL